MPGRAAESRLTHSKELKATSALWFSIEDASVKIRAGGVNDDKADIDLPHWVRVFAGARGFRYTTPDT